MAEGRLYGRFGRLLALAAATGGLAVWNRMLEDAGGVFGDRLGGELRRYRWRGGKIAYAVAGEGPPLLLLHGIYAGASSYEFRKNFLELSRSFRVYAPDLLGCGLSEKPARRYVPEDITAQVEDFAREEIGERTHLIASSLSATLALPAAVRSPRLFGRLVLICPTGYGSLERDSGRLGDFVYGLFRSPLLGDSLYHALVSRRGIRYYLQNMAYHDPARVTGGLVDEYWRTAHQRGARHLATAFVAGRLNLGAAGYWPRVPQQTMICWGREATTPPLSELNEWLRRNPRTAYRIFRDAALLPHDERGETFNEEVRDFLRGHSRRAPTPASPEAPAGAG